MQGVFLDECMFWMDMPIMFRKVMKCYLRLSLILAFLPVSARK